MQGHFQMIITKMTYGEHNCLKIFITNSPYFAYDHFIMVGNATLPTIRYPQICTCSKKHDTILNMLFKLNVASLIKGYGNH